MSAEMVHACLVEWSLPLRGQCDRSADESAGFSDAESALYVLHQYPSHHLGALGFHHFVHAKGSSFAVAISPCPLTDEGGIVR
jgi:hypothetical protein